MGKVADQPPSSAGASVTAGGAAASGQAGTAANAAAKPAAPIAPTIPPQSLNVYKKIAIIRQQTDCLHYEDMHKKGQIKTVSVQQLGDAIKKATPLVTARPKHDIPVPRIHTVASYERDVPANFGVPVSYVRYHRPSQEEWIRSLEYVADKEDELWLRKSNLKFGGGGAAPVVQHQSLAASEETGDGTSKNIKSSHTSLLPPTRRRPQLTLGMLELIFDLLEKATAFNAIVTFHQAEALVLAKLPQLAVLWPSKAAQQAAATAAARHHQSSLATTSGGGATATTLSTSATDTGILGSSGAASTNLVAPSNAATTVGTTTTTSAITTTTTTPFTKVTAHHVLQDVYQYWVQKRSRFKRPLLRPYWPVTSTDDTNPHLVFRPREKEKYKLRKKRQNDMDAYLKLKQLRSDFDSLRAILDLVVKRQEMHRVHCLLQHELFQQRLYDIVDTSGQPRVIVGNGNGSASGAGDDEEADSLFAKMTISILPAPPVITAAATTTTTLAKAEGTTTARHSVIIRVDKEELKRARDSMPLHFEYDATGRKSKRVRSQEIAPGATAGGAGAAAAGALSSGGGLDGSLHSSPDSSMVGGASASASSTVADPVAPGTLSTTTGGCGMGFHASATAGTDGVLSPAVAWNVAGRNFGEPAPNFLHPLATREMYCSSWDRTVPHRPTYVDSHVQPTLRFRHRPRIARGGRLCIDRMPLPDQPLEVTTSIAKKEEMEGGALGGGDEKYKTVTPHTMFTAGRGLPNHLQVKGRLLDLLPKPLNHSALSQKLEEMSVAAIKEDFEARAMSGAGGEAADHDENDGDEVIASVGDWLDTDDQLWGDERYSIGPI